MISSNQFLKYFPLNFSLKMNNIITKVQIPLTSSLRTPKVQKSTIILTNSDLAVGGCVIPEIKICEYGISGIFLVLKIYKSWLPRSDVKGNHDG